MKKKKTIAALEKKDPLFGTFGLQNAEEETAREAVKRMVEETAPGDQQRISLIMERIGQSPFADQLVEHLFYLLPAGTADSVSVVRCLLKLEERYWTNDGDPLVRKPKKGRFSARFIAELIEGTRELKKAREANGRLLALVKGTHPLFKALASTRRKEQCR